MRTVTFSDRNLQNMLNQNFVNTFNNTEGDPTAGQSIQHRPSDPAGSCIRGNGKQNVQTIFMTPAGEIFHVATGFLSSEDLFKEAQFSLDLFGEMHGEPESWKAEQIRWYINGLLAQIRSGEAKAMLADQGNMSGI